MRQGVIYDIQINKNANYFELLMFLADICKLKLKNRVFVYDLETTGLCESDDIIQRHCVDFTTNCTVSTGFLNFDIPSHITQLTGITQ